MGPPFLYQAPAIRRIFWNAAGSRRLRQCMTRYRFITPKRRGKWYRTLAEAQARANLIGAGFMDAAGSFVAYRGTVLEMDGEPVR